MDTQEATDYNLVLAAHLPIMQVVVEVVLLDHHTLLAQGVSVVVVMAFLTKINQLRQI